MRVTSFELEDQDLRDRIDVFMARFKIGTLLNRVGIIYWNIPAGPPFRF